MVFSQVEQLFYAVIRNLITHMISYQFKKTIFVRKQFINLAHDHDIFNRIHLL